MASTPERGDVAMRFGRNLQGHRRAAQRSQEDVAFHSALHRTEIGLLERGQRVPGIDTLVRLAAALSVPPGKLLDGIVWKLPTTEDGRFDIEPEDAD